MLKTLLPEPTQEEVDPAMTCQDTMAHYQNPDKMQGGQAQLTVKTMKQHCSIYIRS